MDLAVSPLDKKLVVATHGRGVYKISLSSFMPVELISFDSKIIESSVLLTWSTATELNNNGFEIQRSTENEPWHSIGFVNGHGTTQLKNNYSYTDINANSVIGQNIKYRLKQNDFNGKSSYSNEITISKNSIPNGFSLQQNYPNPFNGGSVIKFSTPKSSDVSLILYDIKGKEIKVLISGYLSTGQHQISLSSSEFEKLSSGVYLYKLFTPGFSAVRKMIFLK